MGAMAKSTHTADYRLLCEALADLRHNAGLSQRALAERLNVARSWVAKVESGERRLDLVEFCWICRACDHDPARAAADLIGQFRSGRISRAR
jgi:transcriptional regulator with XRE-family HTH domain